MSAHQDCRSADFLGSMRGARLGLPTGPRRVLTEMRGAGLTATELGPEGFLPTDADELNTMLRARTGLCRRFVPVCCSTPTTTPPMTSRPLESLVAAGAGVVVLAAATGRDGYDSRPVLDEAQWATLFANLDRLAQSSPTWPAAVLHPHVGTIVETGTTSTACWLVRRSRCAWTPDLLIGGTDPLELAGRTHASLTPTSRTSTPRSQPRCNPVS